MQVSNSKLMHENQMLMESSVGGAADFSLPRSDVRLSAVFEVMESQRERLGISDWGITETTLEEVFLAICNQCYSAP